MSRSVIRFAVALAPPLLAILVAAAWTSGAGLPQTILRPDAASSYCYTWDLANNTGQDASGLRLQLKGIQSISQVFTGTTNPFGAPHPTSGYDPGTDVYTLVFSDGVAFDSDRVHMGVCTDKPILQLGQQSAAWTLNGQALQPPPLFAGLSWDWQSSTHLQLHLFNSQATTMTLMELNVLDADTSLALDDLNMDTAEALALEQLAISDPQTLAPGANSLFDVFLGTPRFNHPYLIEAVLAAEDDPGNTFRLYSQATSPPAVIYLPMIMRES